MQDEHKENETVENNNEQDVLRQLVRAVMIDGSLSAKEKTVRVQDIMMRKWREAQHDKEHSIRSHSFRKNFTDESRTRLGCSHYTRKCQIVAPCCQEVFPCRLCHDEASDHTIDRYAIRQMLCSYCLTVMPIQGTCSNEMCSHFGAKLAHYFCDICNFFDDDVEKDIYHCHDCGLCRRGKGIGIDYQHCSSCNACINVRVFSEHKCIERSLESNCPICHEFMFTSVQPVIFMACGHAMHSDCFQQYLHTDYTCPVCMKSIVDMTDHFQLVDEYLQDAVMPEDYRDIRVLILCNDCLEKSETDFQFFYHKCAHCSSYNTKLLTQWRPDDIRGEESEDDDDDSST